MSVCVSTSRTSAASSCSRRRRILVSRCAWSFLASWYSEFSLRSPHSRAVLMRSAISRRATVSSCSSSAWRAFMPSAVMTTESLKRNILVLWGETATPLAVIAHRHQGVGDPRAQHEVAGVAGEGDRRGRAGHRDRRAPTVGEHGLKTLPDGRRLRGDDRYAVDGGLHVDHPTRTYVRMRTAAAQATSAGAGSTLSGGDSLTARQAI